MRRLETQQDYKAAKSKLKQLKEAGDTGWQSDYEWLLIAVSVNEMKRGLCDND